MYRYFLCLLLFSLCYACSPENEATEATTSFQPAPFTALDTICTNDWWNRGENRICDVKNVNRDSTVAFAAYTTGKGTLKLLAQLYPLLPEESREVRFELKYPGKDWQEVTTQPVNEIGWATHFRTDDWDDSKSVDYRIRNGPKANYSGTIRANPADKNEIVLAALSCNSNKGPEDRKTYVDNINALDPDLIFFAGDQSYDHREHTAAWLRFGRQFGELFRSRPMISIPDDHDIGQGNLWGESGKKASSMAGNDGGYFFHHEYIKMVERAQTHHLPDPYDATPIGQGIGVYYTSYNVGGIDFAILEDRKFKTGPKHKIPQQGPRPDHIRNPDYDPTSVDVPGLTLLGDRQLTFLDDWAENREGVAMKAVLSQTGFCGGAHIHGNLDNRLHADMDSNGWPQTGRNKALTAIKKAGAVHIAGDQHLSTVIQHGIDEFRDGPWAFVVPAVYNNYYSRWWWPADEQAGANPPAGAPLPWLGDYRDGFDNRITLHAYANPDAKDEGAGFGLIRFDKAAGTVTFECWPRYTDVTEAEAAQFIGWPITVKP